MAEFKFTVTNLVSDAQGGLQNTIDQAVAQVTTLGDTIRIDFDPTLSGQTIVLSKAINLASGSITIDGDLDDDETPDITISGDVTGNGVADAGDVAFLVVNNGATATVTGVTFEDGFSSTDPAGQGGAASLIANYGTLTFNDVLIRDSTADRSASSALINPNAVTILNTGVFSAEDIHIENVSSRAANGGVFEDGGDAVVGIQNIGGTVNLNRVAIAADQVVGGDGSGNGDGGDAILGGVTNGGVIMGYNGAFVFGTGAADLVAGSGAGTGADGAAQAAIQFGGAIPLQVSFIGSAEDDTLTATSTGFLGSFGDDLILSGANDDLLFGGAGDDTLRASDPAAANGADTLSGGGGDDLFIISAGGAITVSGDGGGDTIQFDTAFGVDARLNVDGTVQQSNGLNSLTIVESGVENLTGSETGDTLIGDDGANVLTGRGGADQLFGGDGADMLSGGEGADLLRAGAGAGDVLSGGAGNDTLTVDGGASTMVNGDANDDLIQINSGANAVVDGGDGADTAQFFQTQSSFSFFRGADADTFLVTPAGQTSSFTGEGAVTISNVETFVFSDATLTAAQIGALIDASQPGGGDTVTGGGDTTGGNTGGGTTGGGTAGGGTTGGPTPGDDILTGTTGNDRINALAGNDLVRGLAGDDTLIGSGGKDSLKGGGGSDRLKGGGGKDDLKGGGGADRLFGNGGKDSLKGGGGDDRLIGNGGKDRLEGQGGDDTLKGGGGSDQFVFARNRGDDVVLDFRNGQDKLVIKNGADAFDDLTISDSGPGAVVAFANVTIVLRGVQSQQLDDSDFIF